MQKQFILDRPDIMEEINGCERFHDFTECEYCDVCGEVFEIPKLTHYDGKNYCPDCFKVENLGQCAYCGDVLPKTLMEERPDGWYCVAAGCYNLSEERGM